jgi:hypothetical protein
LTNRWWSAKGKRAWKLFFSSSASSNYSEVNKYEKKNSKTNLSFLMLRPTVGGLAKAHLWSKDLKLFGFLFP